MFKLNNHYFMNKSMNRNTLLIVLFAISSLLNACNQSESNENNMSDSHTTHKALLEDSERALFIGTWRQDVNKDYQYQSDGNAIIVLNEDGTVSYECDYTKLYGKWQLTTLDSMKVILLTDTVENNYDNEKSMGKYSRGIGDYYYKRMILHVVELSDRGLYFKYIGQSGYYENFLVHYFRKINIQ